MRAAGGRGCSFRWACFLSFMLALCLSAGVFPVTFGLCCKGDHKAFYIFLNKAVRRQVVLACVLVASSSKSGFGPGTVALLTFRLTVVWWLL